MKKFKKLLSFVLIFMLAVSTSVFAADKNNGKKIPKPDINQKALEELFKKYDVKVLSPEEAKALNLDKSGGTQLPTFMSIDDIEQYIIKAKKELNKKEEQEINIHIDSKYGTSLSKVGSNDQSEMTINSLVYGSGTKMVTTTLSYTRNVLSDMTIRTSAAVTYQYDYEQYPGEPPIYSNYRIISYDDGNVVQTSSLGYNRFNSLISSSCHTVSATRLQHDYQYTYDQYTYIPTKVIGIPVKIGSGTITGTTYYNIN